MVLAGLPTARLVGDSGRIVMRAWVGLRIWTLLFATSTASPVMTRRAKSVPPLGPLTVAMTLREGGVGELVLFAATKPRLAGVTMNCCPAVPGLKPGVSPPPWQAATMEATSAAEAARVRAEIPAIADCSRIIWAGEYIDGS